MNSDDYEELKGGKPIHTDSIDVETKPQGFGQVSLAGQSAYNFTAQQVGQNSLNQPTGVFMPTAVPSAPDPINRPEHYAHKNPAYETIKILENVLTKEEYIGHLKGCVLKYNIRARNKGGAEDYAKGEWYQKELARFTKWLLTEGK